MATPTSKPRKSRKSRKSRKPRRSNDDIYKGLAETIIGAIQRVLDGTDDRLPWRQPWLGKGPGGAFDRNPHTGTTYRGINTLVLWLRRAAQGYSDNRWGTYKNWQDVGGQVRRGEKGTQVIYWNFIEKIVEDANGTPERDASGQIKTRRIGFLKTSTVFNRDQVDGLEGEKWSPVEPSSEEPTDPTADETSPLAEAVIGASKCPVRYQGAQAYYNLTADSITLPPRAAFEAAEGFYATALHEQIHSTLGRLDEVHTTENRRKNRRKGGKHHKGTQAYAFEELVAEFGSAFLCAATGVRPAADVDANHVAYLLYWIQVLKDDPKKLYEASILAEDASKYLLAAAGLDGHGEALKDDAKEVKSSAA